MGEGEDIETKESTGSPFFEKSNKERRVELKGLGEEELIDKIIHLQNSVDRDPLTGWYRKEKGIEVGLEAVRHSRRNDEDMWVVMLDFDGFKKVNDEKGHKFGDSVLKQTGMTVSKNLRAGEVMARYGGDEGLLIIPKGTAESVDKAIDRINGEIGRDLSFLFEDGEKDLIPKFSSGKASLNEVLEKDVNLTNTDAFSGMVRLADDKLYEKKNG